jgi:AcrR family transcriptional regulator
VPPVPKQQAADTRALLLDAALNAFARHGYAGTSVRTIARAAGLSDSGLYAHFRSKQDLYQALMREVGPQAALTSGDSIPDDPPATSANWSTSPSPSGTSPAPAAR